MIQLLLLHGWWWWFLLVSAPFPAFSPPCKFMPQDPTLPSLAVDYCWSYPVEIFLNNDGGKVSLPQGFVRTTGLQLFRRTAFLLALAGSLSHGFCGRSWGPDLPLSLPEGEGTFSSAFCANISLLVRFRWTMIAFVSTSLFLNSKCTLASPWSKEFPSLPH